MEQEESLIPVFWIAGGLTLTLVLVLFIIIIFQRYNVRMREELAIRQDIRLQHQKELTHNSVEIQEKERSRIAADIHDDLIAQLYRIKTYNNNGELNEMLKKSIHVARMISHDLYPPLLQLSSLEDIFSSYLHDYHSSFQFLTYFDIRSEERIAPEIKLHVFRIFQEAITNCFKHANASAVSVHFRKTNAAIGLKIENNGRKLQEPLPEGLGMKSIALRAEIIDAQFRLKNNSREGVTFLLLTNNEPDEKADN